MTHETLDIQFQGNNNEWMEFRRFLANRNDIVRITDLCDISQSISVQRITNICLKPKISVGIVFSGMVEEYAALFDCITSFSNDSMVGEIIVLTSFSFSLESSILNMPNVRIVEIPIDTNPRILYCRKKNWVIQNAKYDTVLVAHTRIRYLGGLKSINTKYWDIACGHVTYQGRSNLDLIYTKKTANGLRFVRSDLLPRRCQYKWDTYVDGGCFLVRKNHLAHLLDERLAWSEQEDYDFCVSNNLKSREIVKFHDLRFETTSNKLDYKHPLLYWPVKLINFIKWF